jgi:non-ribosomal peptide synthetase component F
MLGLQGTKMIDSGLTGLVASRSITTSGRRRIVNQNDIVVGTPVANRHYQQIEPLIGFFVNTLVLRAEIDSEEDIRSFIRKVGMDVIDAQLHQDLPFEKLVEELNTPKDTTRNPIFQVMFGVQGFGNQQPDKSLFEQYTEELNYSVAKFDITTMINDSQTKLSGSFNYATSLFNEESIKGYIETYLHILTQFSEIKPATKLSQLSYLNQSSYQTMVYDWNKTEKAYPDTKTIHELFEEQVAKTPDNIAVVYEDTKLTYQELNQKANQLAHYLRANYTIQGDDLVALCLDRSEYMLIAILGTLKAGGAYVPMDPSYPDERIGYILEDTKAKVVITNELYAERLCSIKDTWNIDKSANDVANAKSMNDQVAKGILAIDSQAIQNKLSQASLANPEINISSQHLAYVIYTSGTTGKPKGVMVEHNGVVCFSVCRSYIQIDQNTTILGYSNYVFDGSIFDMFSTILNGGKLPIQVFLSLKLAVILY